MDNRSLADVFTLFAKLLDIHGDNSFRAKSYSSAAFTIDRFPDPIHQLPREKVSTIKGIGPSTAQKIFELLDTGKIQALEDLIAQTPSGILQMMKIKGIGPKKIHAIWKEMEIETIGELLYACKENRLKLYKGFGEKTQQAIAESIEFFQKSQGRFLYAQLNFAAEELQQQLSKIFGEENVQLTGQFIRQCEIIDSLDFLILGETKSISDAITFPGFKLKSIDENCIEYQTGEGIAVKIYAAQPNNIGWRSVYYSGAPEFREWLAQQVPASERENKREDEILTTAGKPSLPPYLREQPEYFEKYTPGINIIKEGDIRGIIHCHSTWSDGDLTIQQLVDACKAKNLEYLVISDHSRSAFYAQGLQEERIIAQHSEIDRINAAHPGFRVFKGIESDILNDGRLDYADDVLASFEVVIASVHSNLKMTEDKANERLIRAIENPFTTILGHMTGRLLLSRNGYPINHKKVIDACVANGVVIELNAHPNRLDIDWRHIGYALDKGAMISIDPDAHFIEGLDDIRYGVLMAQKAMLPPEKNLSSFSLDAFTAFLQARRQLKMAHS